jgi:hypothetical protein
MQNCRNVDLPAPDFISAERVFKCLQQTQNILISGNQTSSDIGKAENFAAKRKDLDYVFQYRIRYCERERERERREREREIEIDGTIAPTTRYSTVVYTLSPANRVAAFNS